MEPIAIGLILEHLTDEENNMFYKGYTSDEVETILECKLDIYIDEMRAEAIRKFKDKIGSYDLALMKSLAYAALEDESYATMYVKSLKWTEEHLFAILHLKERCEEYFLKSLERDE